MTRRLRIAWLPDGKRLNLKDGPMDLIIQGFGRPGDIARAYDAAIARMRDVLDELNTEITAIRGPIPQPVTGRAARRMTDAVAPFLTQNFITPLAAVAGAVADDVLASMLDAAQLERAFVNNGGDIALHLAPGQAFSSSILDRPGQPLFKGDYVIDASSRTRGIATSGLTSQGFTLGMADAVTVGAVSAAAADAAATIIANATDLADHHAVSRAPANALQPNSDLGDILVTTQVGPLSVAEKHIALEAGATLARKCLAAGLITGAALYVQGESVVVSPVNDA